MRCKTHHVVFIHIALMGLLASAPPSASTPTLPPAPSTMDDETLAIVDELAAWVGAQAEEEEAAGGWGTTIRSRAESFDVFRTFHPEDMRYDGLSSVPFGATIERVARRHDVDPWLVAAVIEAESSFNPNAVSHRGAVGLMQVMPTSAPPALAERLAEPVINIEVGTAYLAQLMRWFDGDLELVLAGYNAGPNAVRRHGGVPPYRETLAYVEKVLGRYVGHHRDVWRQADVDFAAIL